MANFPTLYRRGTELHSPVMGDIGLAHDPTIRSPMSEGGYITTRARFTRPPETWPLKYE